MSNFDVVVGGGIAGLLAALLMSERRGRRVLIIERENELGGLLRCFDYGEYGVFDYGMHTMYETGIAGLDDLLFGLLPKSDWQLLEHAQRDLAGVIFNGFVQHNSPFPDLRSLPHDHWESCILSFFRQLESQDLKGHNTAWQDINSRFGDTIAQIIDAALLKQFGKSSHELDPFASHLTTLSRVIMFSEDLFSQLIDSPILRDRLAWPEQRTLPTQWESGRKSYYPRNFGMYRVVEALCCRLQDSAVEVMTCSQVSSLDIEDGHILRIKVDEKGTTSDIDVNELIWTSGLPGIAKLMNLDLSGYRFDPPRKIVLVNILLRKPPQMSDLHYLYCYQTGSNIFRITNFTAYCDNAPRAAGWPLSVELLMDNQLPSEEEIKESTLHELKKFNIIDSDADVFFSAVETLKAGFPVPSVNNFGVLSDIRAKLFNSEIKNLTLLGILSEDNVFFQRDVLAQIWTKLIEKQL